MDERLVRDSAGFLRVVNLPSEQELNAHYSQRYFQEQRGNYRNEYSDDEIDDRLLEIDRWLHHAICLSGKRGGGRALDIGAGEGWVMRHLLENGWHGVKGVDFSAHGMERHNPDLVASLEIGDVDSVLDRYAHEGQTFDLVWMDHVLEHVRDPRNLLAKVRAVLSAPVMTKNPDANWAKEDVHPGGVLVIIVPNDGSAFQDELLRSERVPHPWWIAPPEHLSYFTPVSLSRLCSEAGFRVLDVQATFPIDWFLVNQNSNYVADPEKGEEAHRASMFLRSLIRRNEHDAVNFFYRSLARLGLGREIVVFLETKS